MSLFGTSWGDPKTAAILGVAGGLLQGNAGAGLQQGLLGYQRQAAINSQSKRQDSADARDAELFGMKKAEFEREIRKTEAAEASDQAMREALKQAAMDLQAGTFNPAKYAGVIPLDKLEKFTQLPTWGKPKATRQIEVDDGKGGKRIVLADDQGNEVAGFAGYVPPVQVNTGNSIMFTKPTAGQSFAVGMSPSERDASARGWASNRIAQERLNLDKSQGQYQFNAELGGYVPKAPGGQFVPLEGSPNAGAPKLTEGEAKAGLYLGQMRSASDTLDQLERRGVTARPESVAMAGSFLGNYLAPKEAQQVAQVRNQWSEAYLRAKTGAAATQGEVDLNNRTFFPQPGDSQAVIEQKAQARRQAELDMQMPAGRAAQRTQIATPPTPKPGQMGSGTFRILSVE